MKSVIKQVIVMRTDLGMSTGKMVAQGAHASYGAVRVSSKTNLEQWVETWGTVKIVLRVASQAALTDLRNKAVEAKLAHYLVQDAGLTEVEAGTRTCLAIGPAAEEEIDKITGKLELL